MVSVRKQGKMVVSRMSVLVTNDGCYVRTQMRWSALLEAYGLVIRAEL